MRKCPFRRCARTIAGEMYACPHHWRQLTPLQKRTITACYANYREGSIGVERLREIQQGVLDENQGKEP